MPGVSFPGTWEIGTAFTDGTMTFLAGVGGIGRGASLAGVRRVRAVMSHTDAWKVGAETSVACFGDLGVKATIV